MTRLIQVNNLLLATLWHAQLESAGIACEIRNRFIGGAVGDLPPDMVSPEIWVVDDADLNRARTLLRELRNPPKRAPWNCFQCGELNEDQFAQCWKCQSSRPGSAV
jgi:hypothetical protein